QERRIRSGELHQDLWMLPFALLGDVRIDRDAVLQFESTVRDYGLEEVSNLLCGGDFVCNRHVLARSSQLAVWQERREPRCRLSIDNHPELQDLARTEACALSSATHFLFC